jgi:hypothetical protein
MTQKLKELIEEIETGGVWDSIQMIQAAKCCQIMAEALEFYANGNTWYRGNEDQPEAYICSRLPIDQEKNGVGPNILAGKLARQAQQEVEKVFSEI